MRRDIRGSKGALSVVERGSVTKDSSPATAIVQVIDAFLKVPGKSKRVEHRTT